MKRVVCSLLAIGVVGIVVSTANAATPVCQRERTLADRASRAVTKAETSIERLQTSIETRQERNELRQASLELTLGDAEGEVRLVVAEAAGQGLSCLLEHVRRPSCLSSTTRNLFRRITRARSRVRSAQRRLDSFKASAQRQQERYAKKLEAKQADLVTKQADLAAKDAAYSQCMQQSGSSNSH